MRHGHQAAAATSPRRQRSGTTVMVIGTVVAALGAYVLQFVGGRTLGPQGFAPVSALWTLMFIISSVVHLPLEQQVTRTVASGQGSRVGRRASITSIVIAAALGVTFVAVTRDALFEGDGTYGIQTAVLFTAVGVASVRRGELAGGKAYWSYGLATTAHTVAMLALGLVSLAFVGTAQGLIWALALAPLANLLFRPLRIADPSAHEAGSLTVVRRGEHGRFLGAYIAASVSSQGLLAAGPLAVVVIGGDTATISILFVTFTLFRAPLTLLYAMQARVLPVLVGFHFAKERRKLRAIMLRVAAVGAVLAPSGFGAGWVLGPPTIAFLYGSNFALEPVVAGAVAAGMVLATATHLAGQVLVASGLTGRLAVAWSAGLVAAAGAIPFLPGEPGGRVALAFLIGESVALVGTSLLGVRRPGWDLSMS